MDKAYPPGAWKRLGEELERRRGQLGYGFRQREKFLLDRGGPPPSIKTLSRLERGERTSYPPSTIALLESMYGYEPGSFEAVLCGEKPVPSEAPLRELPASPLAMVPDAPAEPDASPSERALRDLLDRYPEDRALQALGAQSGKPAGTRVAEILEWLDFLASRSGNASAGLQEIDHSSATIA